MTNTSLNAWRHTLAMPRWRTARRAALLVTTVLAAIVPTTDSLAAPTSYAMVCKGGGNILITVDDVNPQVSVLKLLIKPSAFRGDSGKLVAGECAWLDRPLTAEEPRRLATSTPLNFWRVSRAEFLAKNRTLSSFTLGPTNASGVSVAAAADVQKLLVDAWTPDKTFYVHAYVDPALKMLIITKIGP